MAYLDKIHRGTMWRFAACHKGTVPVELALMAVAMVIGIAVAVGDIGSTLLAGTL